MLLTAHHCLMGDGLQNLRVDRVNQLPKQPHHLLLGRYACQQAKGHQRPYDVLELHHRNLPPCAVVIDQHHLLTMDWNPIRAPFVVGIALGPCGRPQRRKAQLHGAKRVTMRYAMDYCYGIYCMSGTVYRWILRIYMLTVCVLTCMLMSRRFGNLIHSCIQVV